MAVRTSSAEWKGTLREGSGTMEVGKTGYKGPYTYASRFEEGRGQTRRSWSVAAHAGCFSMFLAALLTDAGFPPIRVHTTATVHLEKGPTITLIELNTEVEAPNLTEAQLLEHATAAKKDCLSRRLLPGRRSG